MLTIVLIIFLVISYLSPGFMLARGMYSSQIRKIRTEKGAVVPNKPPRPELKVNELLHTSKCAIIRLNSKTCSCSGREGWIDLKNEWQDYNEWINKYQDIANKIERSNFVDKPNMLPIYLSVPFWPLTSASMFIKAGAKNIPDFREIERLELENDMKVDV